MKQRRCDIDTRVRTICRMNDVRFEDLAKISDKELLTWPLVGRKVLKWIRDNSHN